MLGDGLSTRRGLEKNSLVTNRGTSVFFVPTNVAAVTLAANHKYRLESVKLGVTNIPTFLHDLLQ